MEETRADLTNKLSALEQQVTGTVQAATDAVETTKDGVTGTVEAVTETVENVKESVQETVSAVTEQVQETVKSVAETFNVKLQAERHPWLVFGGSVAVGALAGYLLGGSSRRPTRHSRSDFLPAYSAPTEVKTQFQPEAQRPADQSLLGGAASAAGSVASTAASVAGKATGALGGLLGNYLGNFKGLAVGALMNVVRELASRSLPENMKDKVAQEVDNITRSLGGEPIKGSILPESNDEAGPPADNGHGQQHRASDLAASRY